MKRIILMAMVMILAGCGGGSTTDTAVTTGTADVAAPAVPVRTEASNKAAYDKAIAPLQAAYAQWNDADKLAEVTGRANLFAPVLNLQNIKRDTGALIVPACLVQARMSLTLGMDAFISGYIAFMQQQDTSGFWTVGYDAFTLYQNKLLEQKLCDFTIMP